MKKFIYTIAFVLVSTLGMAQTTTENYVKTVTYQTKTTDGTHNADTSAPLTDDDKIEAISYFDGLGRPLQSISKQSGGQRQDLLVPFVYDQYGRQVLEYLPYARSSSSLNIQDPTLLLSDQQAFYLAKYPNDLDVGTPSPFSEKHLEASPLSRVLEQGAPGADWSVDRTVDTDHTIKFEYQSNSSDLVRLYKVNFPFGSYEQPQLYFYGFYQDNELYKTITKDENWQPGQTYDKDHTTEEYKDKQGRVILKRSYNKNLNHDTYYVYDDFGNLTYVLSPKADGSVITNSVISNFSQTIGWKSFSDKYNGVNGITLSGDVGVSLIGSELKISFNLDFSGGAGKLRLGAIEQLTLPLPNMVIGSIPSDSGAPYIVSVQDGYLHLAGGDLISGSVNNTIAEDVPIYGINQDIVDKLCYQYHYDKRNRLVEKKIPGKHWEYIIYDKLDRPVLTQDANLKASNHWLFTKYDAFGRVVYTGKYSNGNDRTTIQNTFNFQTQHNEARVSSAVTIDGTAIYYSNSSFPTVNLVELHTVNYYDDYPADLAAVVSAPTTVFGAGVTTNTNGLATGSKVRVLDTNDWITSVTYYDDKARPIYAVSKNDYLDTEDIMESELDFLGKPLQTKTTHTRGTSAAIIVTDTFTYDHAGRLLTQSQVVDGSTPELIVNNHYDELGQLITKGVGGTLASIPENSNGLQSVDYTYNIRGWLRQINNPQTMANDLFGFEINYNDPTSGGTALYNGNISQTFWKTDNTDKNLRHYDYEYDALNRITSGVITNDGNATENDKHNLKLVEYDQNGNILILRRSGYLNSGSYTFWLDHLSYTYDGNQLTDVLDEGHNYGGFASTTNNQTGDYFYDANGNMIEDKNKNIQSIDYNHLNLPTRVTFSTGNALGNSEIVYIYDATGIKQKKIVVDMSVNNVKTTQTTQYAGNYIYEQSGNYSHDGQFWIGNEVDHGLKFFSHPEGYVEPDTQGGYEYVYQYKDHLGNIRLAYKKDNTPSISFKEDFNTNTGIWSNPPAGSSINNNNGKLNINLLNQWNGINKYLDITPGVPLQIEFDFENGTIDKPVFYVRERINGVWEPGADRDMIWDIQDGHHTMTLTLTGDHVQLRFEKALGNDNGTLTNCFIDNFTVTQNGLEILEENNYYPFGLKHKGYNDIVSANVNDAASKYKYNGKEFDISFDINTYDLGARQMDPTIGRFMVIDPMADFVNYQSPYVMADNNPIGNIDAYGLGSRPPWWLRWLVGGSGRNCSCKQREGVFGFVKRLFDPKPRRPKRKRKKIKTPDPAPTPTDNDNTNDDTKGGDIERESVSSLNFSPEGLVDIGISPIEPPTISPFNLAESLLPIPKFNGREITPDNPLRIESSVEFKLRSGELKDEALADKTLNDLIKTLREYPQLKVLILGNISLKPRPDGTKPKINPGPSARGVMTKRAEAIQKFLIDRGISWERISHGYGEIRFEGQSGRTTTIILHNN